MLAHVALPSCQTEGGYWAGERGLLSTAQVQCGKNGGFDVFSVWLYLFILLLLYIVISRKVLYEKNIYNYNDRHLACWMC